MRISPDRLAENIARELRASYWISGDEPLLVAEAAEAVRSAARAKGFTDRQVFFVARYFDWDEVRTAARSLSLFADKRIIEIRMPSGKPESGADLLVELIERPVPDLLMLIVTDKLDKKTADAPWARAAETRGASVAIVPVGKERLPQWLIERSAKQGIALEPAAAELIAERAEGNLLAADQEITKLGLLSRGRSVDAKLVMNSVGDSARYDIYQLASAAAHGDAARAVHILAGLKAEGTEPTLILWALTRELRGLWQALERQRLGGGSRGSAWNLASPPAPQTLARARKLPVARMLAQASVVDRIIKGAARGDTWAALMTLVAGFAGSLPGSMMSDRAF